MNATPPPRIPFRGPDYSRRFPSDEALAAAIEMRRRVGALLEAEETAEPLKGESQPEVPPGFDLGAIAETSPLSTPLSSSALGEYVCSIVNTSVVPCAHGHIDSILLTVPRDPGSPSKVGYYDERHFRRLFELLGGGTEFVVVCKQDQIDTVERWAADAGVNRLTPVLSVYDYTIWAQDAYVALTTPQHDRLLCEGVLFTRDEDVTVADDVSMQTSISAVQSVLRFEGGNVLGGPTANLIGKDYVWQNEGRKGLETTAKVLARYERLFGSPVVSVGRTEEIRWQHRNRGLSGIFQPIFHIDMYVTPTGVTGKDGKEIALVGRPAKARELLNQPPGPFDWDVYFAETETQLAQRFEVRQLPLLPVNGNLNDPNREVAHYHLTWNNAVLENWTDDSGKVHRYVYMPTYEEDAVDYGLDSAERKELDEAAEDIWKDAGFKVRRMDGLEELAYARGSVHCITKTLARSGFRANRL